MRMVRAWSAAWALYLKVSPNGLRPAARSRPVAGFKGRPLQLDGRILDSPTTHPLHLQSALTALLNRI